MKPDCQMHKMQKCEICKDCLRDFKKKNIQNKLSTNWSPKKDQGATTGLLCVLQNGSPIFHSFMDTMLTQNTWCWWAGGVPWCHHFVGSNPHGCYHFVGVPIPFCRGVGWAPYTLVGPSSRGEFQGGSQTKETISCAYVVFSNHLVTMGAAGHLGVFCVLLFLFDDGPWGGVGWDVNVHVHVTLMMLRWSWGGVGWDVNVHAHGVGRGGMLAFMFMLRWWCFVDHGVGY